MGEYTLGIYIGVHGASCSLLQNGRPVVAVQLERILGIRRAWIAGRHYNVNFCQERVRHDSQKELLGFSAHFDNLLSYSLSVANIKLNQINCVAVEKRNLLNCPIGGNSEDENNEIDNYFKDICQIKRVEHHQGHQAQAFYSSPFKESLVLTVDGRSWDHVDRVGGPICTTASIGNGNQIETFHESSQSLTSDYYDLSMKLFERRTCEGKTMGLSAYGILQQNLTDSDNNYFTKQHRELNISDNQSVKQFYSMISDRSKQMNISELEPIRKGEEPTKSHVESAWHCQKYYESDLIALVRAAYKEFGCKNLCISGGGGLNSVANGRLLDDTPIDNLHIFPNCGDEGQSLGFALWAYYAGSLKKRNWHITDDFLGKAYSPKDIERALSSAKDRIIYSLSDNIYKETAQLLKSGAIVGWFQGGSEFGPRALGHRSILAHPGIKGLKDKINSKVKHREMWRPFAPVIMEEHVAKYFDFNKDSRFMLLVRNVLSKKIDEIENVIHIDGTARLQTVALEDKSHLRSLLCEFYDITSTPLLLNTSLNVAGKPIVETPSDAISVLTDCELDVLVLDKYIVKRIS